MSENKQTKTFAVVRENVGILHEIVGTLTSMGQDVVDNNNGPDLVMRVNKSVRNFLCERSSISNL